jgi:hypothetical protein
MPEQLPFTKDGEGGEDRGAKEDGSAGPLVSGCAILLNGRLRIHKHLMPELQEGLELSFHSFAE